MCSERRGLNLVAGLLFVFLSIVAGRARAEDAPLRALTELRSVDGILTATLTATSQPVDLGGSTIPGIVYNGDYPGPVLRVHPGDLMRITLVNRLAEPTNLHFHGIDTSPKGNGDNVMTIVLPGQSFLYEVRIPADQRPGLYWYHAHLHGLSEKQVMGGLTGTLVVEGIEKQLPALAGLQERLFVLKQYTFDEKETPGFAKELRGRIQAIDGQTVSQIDARPGETQFWRLGNQSANLYFHLSVPGHVFRIIAKDGVALTKAAETKVLDIEPASRLEVLFDAGAPGTYDLVSEKVPTGLGATRALNRIVGHIVVQGDPAAPAPEISAYPQLPDLRERPADAERTITFTQDDDRQLFYVNGKLYDRGRIDVRIPLGSVEEWTLKNDSDDMHVFHIHQVSFQVTEVDGAPKDRVEYADVVRVPERGQVKIRMAFTDPTILGRFVFHCHVLKHEDKGMMANIEVYDPRASALSGVADRARDLWQRLGLYAFALSHGLPLKMCGS